MAGDAKCRSDGGRRFSVSKELDIGIVVRAIIGRTTNHKGRTHGHVARAYRRACPPAGLRLRRQWISLLMARNPLTDWQVDRARRDLSGWNEASLGMAIMAAAQADADVKGASRDPVFALERLVTVIATRAPHGA